MKTKFYILLTMLLTCVMQVKGATSTVTVGSVNGGASLYMGFSASRKYYSEELLYLSSEIKGGYITKLGFKVSSNPETTISGAKVKIYLADVPESQKTLSTSNMLLPSAMTEVYNASTTLGSVSDSWNEIAFSKPFYHAKNMNLVVAISITNTTGSTCAVTLQCDNTKTSRAMRKYSDSDVSYATISSTSMSGTDYFPITRFTFSEQSATAVVGTSSGTSNMTGFGDGYKYYGTQILYTIDEIGQAGAISEIAFATSENDRNTSTGTYTVYMAEVDQNTLTVDNRIQTPSQMKQVYYGTATLKVANGYESLQLKTPFYYSGTKNLVVAISSINTSTYNLYYNRYQKSGRVVRYDNSSSSNYAPAFHATGLKNFDYVPVTKFTFSVASSCTTYRKEIGTVNDYSAITGFGARCKYYATQILYPAKLFSSGYVFTYLGFEVKSTQGSVSSDVEIYMAETDLDEINKNSKLTKSQMTRVYKGTKTLGNGSTFEMIYLDTPFVYTGRKNLVIAVSTSNPSSNPIVYYNCSNDTPNRAIIWRSDTNSSYADPFTSVTAEETRYVPKLILYYPGHTSGNFTSDGLGVCRTCGYVMPYYYESPTNLASYTFGVSKVNHLNYIAQRVAWGSYNSSYHFYIQNDLDLNGKDWCTIGYNGSPFVSYLHGCDYSNKVGHTISGVGSNQYLIGTLGTNGQVQSVRLASGRLVKTGTSGKVSSCLTLGDALFGSRTSTVIDSSFYKSSSANTSGGRTLAQMQSGAVTYGLNHASVHPAKWYQTIGSDDYPVFNSSRGTVARCTKCDKFVYNNNANDEGKVYPHSVSTNNTLCSACGGQPTTLSEDVVLDRTKAYARTVQAQMASGKKLTYKRTYGSSDVNKWQSFYVPFAMKYTEAYSKQFDIAEILDFGVFEDTNKDGALNSQDEKKLSVSYLNVGSITKPNTAYLIRPKSNSTITFESYDGKVYPNTLNSIELSTMKDQIVITPTYTPVTTSGAKKQLVGGALSSSTSTLYSFSWYATPSYKNGKTWDQNTINIYAHRFGVTELVDNDNTSNDFVSYTQASDEVVDNLLYERTFVERQAHNWQSMYLPFDVVVEESGDDVYPKYAKFVSITTESGVDYINIQKCVAGDVIPANTPALVCVDEPQVLTYSYPRATIKAASSATNKVFNSGLATYTMIGRYAPYQNTSEWYAISKKDGDFHPMTSTAKLPPYRFYMTIQKKTAGAGELRVVIRDVDEMETAIDSIVDDSEESDAIYTLDGRKVQEDSLQPGIYVKNGKKISVKK